MGSKNTILLMLIFFAFLFANFAYASDAIIAYRSNTGTAPANEIPKIRFWDSSGSGSWGPEIELPSVGDEISYLVPVYSPVSGKIVIVVQDSAGNLNGYVCTSDCNETGSWSVTHDIATVSSGETNDRRFDVKFETLTGNAIIVYEVYSLLNTRDLGYMVLPAAHNTFSGLGQYYINDPGHAGIITNTWISLAAHPSSNELIVAAIDSTNNDINAWVWNGSSWGNQIGISSSASATGGGEALAVAYASDGTKGMVLGAEGTLGFVNWAYWNGASWSSVSAFDIDNGDNNDVRWARLKADPSSDDLQAIFVDSGRDLTSAYWNGSSWSLTRNIETNLDSFSTRVADFAWLPSGSTGILVWENDGNGNQLSHRVCAPECNGSTSTISGYSGAGDFLSLITNPYNSSLVEVLGLRLHTAPDGPDIGSFYYNGSSYSNYGNSVISPRSRTGFEVAVLSMNPIQESLSNCPIINTPGTYIQTMDYVGAPNNAAHPSFDYACVIINAGDVIYDCNGYSINNNGTSDAAGIILNTTRNVTVMNCPDIAYYDTGLLVFYSNNSKIQNVTSNYHNINAFHLVGSHYNDFINNTGHSTSSTAFLIAGNHANNTFINNTAYNSGEDCFYIGSSAANATAINNLAYNCQDNGFEISSSSDNMILINNTAYNTNNGFLTHDTINSRIENNLAYHSQNGFFVSAGSSNNLFINNTAHTTVSNGFTITQDSSYNTFINSTSYNNGAEGFDILQSASYNNYINTTSYNNSGNGLYIREGASDSNFTNTLSYNNTGHGLLIIHSGYYVFENTESYNNTGDGIHTQSGGASNSNFTNTILYGNDAGFIANTASSCNLLDTRIYNNQKGLLIHSGGLVNGNVTNLEVFNNSIYGINMSQSNDILFDSVYLSNNGYDLIVGEIGAISYEMNNAIFDNPSGSMENFTNLSIIDTMSGSPDAYYISWTSSTPPAGFISFEQKWIEIANITEEVSIDTVIWHWTDAESASYDEAAFEVWKNNGTWSAIVLDPDTGANTLTATSLNPASDYGIVLDVTPPDVSIQVPTNTIYSPGTIPLNFTVADNGILDSCWYVLGSNLPVALPGCNNITLGPLAQGDYNITVYANDSANNTGSAFTTFFLRPEGGGNDGKKTMRLSYEFMCPGDLVNFHADTSSSPLSGVSIKILYDEPFAFYVVDTITTDSDGNASIQLTAEGIHRIIAEKNGYITLSQIIDFSFCPPLCTSDSDCQGSEQCRDGICEPVKCAECGIVKDHQCIVYECCSDSDCPEGATCQDHNCQFECYSDSDCDTKAYCSIENNYDGGSCVPVTGICGYAENHIWNSYECGEPDCPPCTTGRCEDHQCVERTITCPETAELGSDVTCSVTENNLACDGCNIQVTDPDGKKTSGLTDKGRFTFRPEAPGNYTISIVVGEEVLLSETIAVALPLIPILPEPAESQPLLEIFPLIAIIGLLLLLFFFWKKKKKKPSSK